MPGPGEFVRSTLIVLLVLSGMLMSSSENPRSEQDTSSQAKARRAAKAIRGADVVLLGGKVWTGEDAKKATERNRFAQAVAIAGGRILDVGSDARVQGYIGKHTQVIRLGGRLVAPGFIDSHAHFVNGGFQLLEVDLKDARSEEEFVRRIAEKAKSLAPGRWILGGRWDEQAWSPARLPTRWQIDAATGNHPVLLSRYDGHAALANSLALQLAGVTRETKVPADGVIARDDKTGEPTGVLKDAAIDLVARVVSKPTEAEMEEAFRTALGEAARVGVTSVQNITSDEDSATGSFTDEIQLARRAEREGWLTLRLYEIIPIGRWERLAEAGISQGMGSDFVKLGAVKGFADGSLGSGTAWMFEPFDDEPGNRGLPMALMDPHSKMEALVRGATRAHIQSCIHAIGDRAVAEMLDLYARVGGDKTASCRFRIEHAQHVRPEDFARFGRLGVIASMQPYHAIDDGRWAEKRLGVRRSRTSYAWRSMLDAGAPLAFGSDWPVAPLDPILGIYAAVTRATLDGKHPNGWSPQERLTVEEAVHAYTTGSAYAAFQEKEKGTITPGKLADLVVLSDDLFNIPPEHIRHTHVVMTIVGGRTVYEAP